MPAWHKNKLGIAWASSHKLLTDPNSYTLIYIVCVYHLWAQRAPGINTNKITATSVVFAHWPGAWAVPSTGGVFSFLQGMWPYCGHFQLHTRYWLLDQLWNCLMRLPIVNHKDWRHLELRNRSADVKLQGPLHEPRAVTMKLWEPKRKSPIHLQNHVR
jgi:hypothetical protein